MSEFLEVSRKNCGYNVYIVDDHSLFREGLCFLLSKVDFVRRIDEAATGEAFLESLEKCDFSEDGVIDVVLMDIEMPGISGIEATRRAMALRPELKVLALSMYNDDSYYLSMIEAGAVGFMLKNSSFSEVRRALTEVGEGRNYFSEEVLHSLVENIQKGRKKDNYKYDISDREAEVLEYICRGFSNSIIGEKLSISKRTVDKHRENLLLKSGSSNTAQLVVFAIKNGYFKI
jgi:DNA-binding NarL/FixJ family response regulator